MHFQTTGQDLVHEDGLAHKVSARLHCRFGSQVREFKILRHSDGLILHGRVNTYYGKQLAQQAVMEITGLSILANEIAVH